MHSAEVRQTAEPDMEDLLTSIRQAINENVGLPPEMPQPQQPVPLPAGQAEPAPSRADEIAALRSKIANQLREPREPYLASLPRPAPRTGGFAGLFGGSTEPEPPADEPAAAEPAAAEPPPLRGHYLDEEIVEPEPPVHQPAPAFEPSPEPFTPRAYERGSYSSSWNPLPRRTFGTRDSYTEGGGLLSPTAAATTNAAFGRLAESMVARALGEHTIEQMAQDLLRPMLKQWLDDNLPGIVERLVREEIERVARRGSYR